MENLNEYIEIIDQYLPRHNLFLVFFLYHQSLN